MNKIEINNFKDLENIREKISNNEFVIDLNSCNISEKAKIIDFFTGMTYPNGTIKKISSNEFEIIVSDINLKYISEIKNKIEINNFKDLENIREKISNNEFVIDLNSCDISEKSKIIDFFTGMTYLNGKIKKINKNEFKIIISDINLKYMNELNKKLKDLKESKEYTDEFKKIAKVFKQTEEDVIDKLMFKTNGKYKENEHICNFLRFRIINTHLKLFENTDLSDFDTYNEVIKAKKQELSNIIEYINEDNKFTIKGKLYQTDTANSMQTIFGDFMRKNYREAYLSYIQVYNIKGEAYRDYNLLCKILESNLELDTKNLSLQERTELQEQWILLEKLASLYHSIGNIVLVPDGFNSKRYLLVKDYYDLSIDFLKKYGFNGEKYGINKEMNDKLMYGDYFEKYKIFVWDKNKNSINIKETVENMIKFIER